MTENKAETNQYKYKGEYKSRGERERKHTYNPAELFLVCGFLSSLFSNIFFERTGQ